MISPELLRIVARLMTTLNTPRALTCKLLIEAGEWAQLTNLRCEPHLYLCPDAFFRDYQATELLRKCAGLPTGIDTESVAKQGFIDAEQECFRTNCRLDRFLHNGPFEDPEELRLANFFDRVKKRIQKTLGTLPGDPEPFFGPGVSFSTNSRRSTIPDKMQQITLTTGASPFLYFWKDTYWGRKALSESPYCNPLNEIRGNRFTTVPKDATKDRGIAVEPLINSTYQLQLGRWIRGRLKKVGIDLEEGQALHRRVAREASSKGDFCTIDLSSASDTVSKKLVELLLPESWYDALDSLRSPFTLFEGKWHRLEKFSSMGNGFTFELETLIFWALVTSVIEELGEEGQVWVYGDDIICPSKFGKVVTSMLRYCGFTTNKRKTFLEGPFRESCGGDYFNGEAVIPYRLKELPYDAATWIGFANGLRRNLVSRYGIMPTAYLATWFDILNQIPVAIRSNRGPDSLGDVIIHDDESRWTPTWRGGVPYYRVWRPVSRKRKLERYPDWVQVACALYGVPSTGPTPRGSVSGYRFGRVCYWSESSPTRRKIEEMMSIR